MGSEEKKRRPPFRTVTISRRGIGVVKWKSVNEIIFVICILFMAIVTPGWGVGDPGSCESSNPPCPLNARLVNSTNNKLRIQCDEGFELFGDPEVSCDGGKGKWTTGYCATNVAGNRPTNQSSTASITATSSSSSSGKQMSHYANDGLPSTCSQTLKELNPFWKIDLLQSHHVTGIRLSVGAEEGTTSNSVDLEVRVGSNPLGLKNPLCVWQPASEFQVDEKKLLSCARPITGRHLSIQIIGSESALKLCNVEVFATDGLPSPRCSPDSSPTETSPKPPSDLISYNGSCFEFSTKQGQTFSTARSQCVARKGDLLTEPHLKQNSPTLNLITTTLDRLKPGLKRPLIWIGVERDPGFTSRTWRWVDSGLVVKKPNWGKDQPNNYNGEQNCAVLDGGKNDMWTWNDVGCGLDLFHWICVFPPKRCGSPDSLQGTEIINTKDDYPIGTVLKYKCSKEGHFIDSGDETRVCLTSGFWNGSAPGCHFADCGGAPYKSGPLENGTITFPAKNSTFYGSEITYKCNEGYTLEDGVGVVTCGRDGKWSGLNKKCLNSICPSNILDIVNGTFTSTGKTAGSTISYTCNDGHVLIGSPLIKCQLGGNYDNPPPTCKYVTCGEVPNLHNGTFKLTGNAELGSIAMASCDLNFELNNVNYNKIVCGESGNWELYGKSGRATPPNWSSLIKCQLITCEEPEVPNGSFVTGYDFSVGSEIQYHCEEGHVMVGGTEIRRCTLRGTWSGVVPSCRFIDCGRSPTIPFGQAVYPSGKTHLDSTVQYSCAPNYRLNGVGSRTCLATGVWSGSTPKCEETRCTYPHHLPPSSVATVAKNDRFNSQTLLTSDTTNKNATFRIGTILKIRCERGYILEGGKTQTCVEGGVWSPLDSKIMCKFVDCGDPADIINGFKSLTSNTTFFGSAVIYECNSGYGLVGGSRKVCQESGEWGEGVVPKCEETTCPPLPPTNATIEYTSFQVGGLAKYSCGKGSYLLGDSTRQCTEKGVWSGKTTPTCQYVRCPPPPISPNARQFLVNVSTVYSSMVEYHCVPGYSVSPGQVSVLTCSEFGNWAPPTPPTCLNQEEFITAKNLQNSEKSESSSIVGVIVGLVIGGVVVAGGVFYFLYIIKKRGGSGGVNNAKNNSNNNSRKPVTMEPMVVFPGNNNGGNNVGGGGHVTSSTNFNQHYYDNPNVDPIYENLDDYGVTGGSGSVSGVTINGVAVA